MTAPAAINSTREAKDFARLYILALCIWREARGESFRGKLLVGTVIRNRVHDKRWPNTYEGVITQRLQFSAFNPNDPNAVKYPYTGVLSNGPEDAAWYDCVQAAGMVLASQTTATKANHYHTLAVMPPWHDAAKIVDREGAHVFLEL